MALGLGHDHTCAIKSDGTLKCWGYDFSGQVSGPNAEGGTFTQVRGTLNHTCAMKANGTLECWGFNDFGELGAAPPSPGSRTGRGRARRRSHTCSRPARGRRAARSR